MPSSNPCSGQRVLALVTEAFGGYGGIAQHNRDLFCALAKTSETLEIDVLARLAEGEIDVLPVRLNQRPPVFGRKAYAACALSRALRRRPALVFSGHLYHGPLACCIANLTGAKLVAQVRGTEIWGFRPNIEERSKPPI